MSEESDAVDDSPWRPGADVEFVHGDRPTFVDEPVASPVDESVASPVDEPAASFVDVPVASLDDDLSASDADAPPGAASTRRRVPTGAAVAAVLAVTGAGGFIVVSDSATPRGTFDAAGPPPSLPAFSDVVAPADVVVTPIVTPRLQSSCDGPRLPGSIEQRWTSVVDGAVGFVGPLRPGPGTVAALTLIDGGPAPDDQVALVVLDANEGRQRWRIDVGAGSSDPRILSVDDATVIVETNGVESGGDLLTAHDVDDGRVVWTQSVDSASTGFVHPPSGWLIIETADVGPDGVGSTRAIDVGTGRVLNVGDGRFVTIDVDGRLVTLAGAKVLSAPAGGDTGRIVIGLLDSPTAPFAVLGTSVLTSVGDPDSLELFTTDQNGRRSSRTVRLTDPDGVGTPGVVTSLTAIGPSGVVLTGRGATFGADLVDGDVVVRWKADGAFQASAPSDLGRTLLLAGEGGATQFLLDAATGEESFVLRTATGALGIDDVFTNGMLVREGVGASASWRASTLDGDELWRFDGLRPPAVGFESVYDSRLRTGTASDPPTLAASIAAFGPAPDPSRECASP